MQPFAQRLVAWQRQHGRHSLPWQHASAYHVWLSEIMLQQTQVVTVIPYYQRFIAAFPNAAALAAASVDDVLAHWSGLGYYARGRNLHRAAQIIAEQHGGEFPRNFEHIIELPGIGRSTAAAICALAYHERRAILDGNVKRVLARYCGIEGWAGEKKVEERLWQQAESLLPDKTTSHSTKPASGQVAGYLPPGALKVRNPLRDKSRVELSEGWGGGTLVEGSSNIATYTQALMDMGATICTRSKPKCDVCPVQSDCVALATDRVKHLPTPRPRKVIPERHTAMLLLMHGNDILLEKRAPAGIWGGMWSLPQFDDEAATLAWCAQRSIEVAGRHSREGGNPAKKINSCEAHKPFTHTFTHFKLHISPLQIHLQHKPSIAAQPGSVWLSVDEALGAAIPAPVRVLLEKYCLG